MEPSYSTHDSTDPFLSMASSLPPAVVGLEATDNDTLKNHPWTTERAKVAAETEISPPISPKQHAHQAGFVEPLQESNLTSSIHHDHSEHTLTHTWSSLDTFTLLASSHLGPESHFSSSSSSSASSSFASSNSSTTSLSSAASESKPFCTLTKLEIIEKRTDLHHLDTPPSSHVPSPSSPSHPSFGLPDTLLDTKTPPSPPPTAPTTIARPSVISKNSKTAIQIIREISDLVDGRDKTIKVIQYFAKVFLWLFLSNPKQYELLASRIKALAKQFSTTRKVLRLGHFIDPMATVLHMGAVLVHNVQKQGWKSTLARKPDASWRNTVRERLGDMNNAIGFVQDISDDIYCLGVIGVLDRSFADKAEPWSNRLWMVGVSIDLHENLQSIWDVKQQIKALQGEDEKVVAQRAKLENKLHWLQVTTVKLSGDFLFCAYDNLHCSFSDGFQAVTGFISGLAGAYKFVGKLVEA
ncbi:Peroxisomal membrane protein PMP27 [Mortierella antarctica]|nr:Peroxisomal membrane protein PMP27 [Mortierella antarctica]